MIYRSATRRSRLSTRQLPDHVRGCFERQYQRWYTEATAVIGQLISGRVAEFQQLYMGDGKRKTVDAAAYTIQDWLTGRCSPAAGGGEALSGLLVVSMRLKTQLEILRSAESAL